MNEIWSSIWRWVYKELLQKLITPDGGVGVVEDLGSGYSVQEAQMENAMKLKALCDEAVSNHNWVAHDITGDGVPETFCNRSVQFIAQGMGYYGFKRDQFANDMIQAMGVDAKWREEPFESARVSQMAQKGVLVVVGLEDHPHGHVVAAAPEAPQESGSWGEPVPMVAQVGTAKIGNGVKKISEAFRMADRARLRVFVLQDSVA